MHEEANKNCNELSNTPREAYENNWKIKFDWGTIRMERRETRRATEKLAPI